MAHPSAAPGSNVLVNPWLVTLTVSMATFMEVMDTSIANVSLRYIAGDLAAGLDESTWVLTSYLISNAIILPISGWLASVMGRKRFYMSCVALFTISSFLCGIAPNLQLLLFFRVLQGLGGGGLAPSEQAILTDTFPERLRGQAFALYGMAVVVAPAIGPALGGWITDTYSWRWIFFINIPVGILSLILTSFLVRDSDSAKQEHAEVWKSGKLKVDYIGFSLVALGLGSLQVVLDKGQEDDWFGSAFITFFAIATAVGILGCILWEFITPDPIVDLPLFKNRNFLTTCLIMFAAFFVLLATTQLLPQYVQQLLNYNATKAGLILMPGGIVIMFLMPVVGKLVTLIQPKYLIAFGLLIMSLAMQIMTTVDTQVSFYFLAAARCSQTAAMAFLFVPINTIAFIGLPTGKTNNASALINLMRNLGSSVGISAVTTLIERRADLHQDRLAGHLTPYNPIYRAALQHMASALMRGGESPAVALRQATASIYYAVQTQALAISYVDAFQILSIAALMMILMVIFLRSIDPNKATPAAA